MNKRKLRSYEEEPVDGGLERTGKFSFEKKGSLISCFNLLFFWNNGFQLICLFFCSEN